MKKYICVSYDDDQQQCFVDNIVAQNKEEAITHVADARPYAIVCEAFSVGEWIKIGNEILERSEEDILQGMKEFEKEAQEA